jgi:conjugal transfer pilus assembly protein TraF
VNIRTILSVLILTVFPLGLLSEDRWWTRHEEGWFFYRDKPVVEKRTEKKEEVRRQEKSGGETFSDRLERAGKVLLSRALENPTEENVRAYMEYNRLSLLLADNFSRMWQKVLLKYPDLVVGSLTYAFEDMNKTIRELSERAGLYVFLSATCEHCRKQAEQLKVFRERHPEMGVLAITLDYPLPEYPDTVLDNGTAQALGVTSVPQIFIVFPYEGRIDPLASGYVDAFELERRLYSYAQPVEKKQVEELIERVLGHLDSTSQ